MTHTVTVGLQQKIGQPNFGSVGASCSIEVQLDDEEVSCPELLTDRVKQAFAQCRASIAHELNDHVNASSRHGTIPVKDGKHAARTPQPRDNDAPGECKPPRMASEAQVRAIRAIASKCRLSLASELRDRFGVNAPADLTISQASQMIDSMKQDLTPSPA